MKTVVELAPELRGTIAGETLATPESCFRAAGTEVLKDHRRTAVARLELGGHEVYLKRFKPYAWYRRLEAAFRGSVARRCRAVASALREAEFDTPRVLALVETGADSWIVTEGRPDARPGGTLWLEEADGWTLRERRRFLVRGAHFLRRLHDAGFYSRDTNANNFLVSSDGGFVLLDLENFHRPRTVSPRRRIKNLVQLHRIVRGRLPAREAVRFVHEYLRAGGEGRDTLRRWWPRLAAVDRRKEREYRSRAAARGPFDGTPGPVEGRSR